DLMAVRRGEPLGDLARDGHGLGKRQRPAGELLLESLALVERQGEEHPPALALARLVERRYVGMVEPGHGLGLVQETPAGAGVAGELGGQELERDDAAEAQGLGFVDLSPGAAPPWRPDLVVGGPTAGRRQPRRDA